MNSSTSSGQVVCAGMLVADLFIPPLAHLPAEGELLATDRFLVEPGGCAANTAVSLAKLGVPAIVSGKVGADIFGDFVIQDLQRQGADTRAIARSHTHSTSQTVILPVIGQDRRYIHTFGANVDFSVADIDPALVATARVLYVGGYLALPGLRSAELAALFEHARAAGAQTVLDVVVPAEAGQTILSELSEVLPHVDYFLPNDDEACQLTGANDPQAQAAQLLGRGCRNVIITMGERGALLMNQAETVCQAAFSMPVVDQSGAGDAFDAGLIVGLLEGWPMAQVLRFASAIGASACSALGCTAGVFTRAQAEAFLAAQG